jgi:hypothetical protein
LGRRTPPGLLAQSGLPAHHIMHTLMVTTYADIMYPPDSEIIG